MLRLGFVKGSGPHVVYPGGVSTFPVQARTSCYLRYGPILNNLWYLQLKRVFEDLRPHLASLLRSRRGGVVAALAAAAGRLGVLESDVAAAL